jgi:hypothetical protein
MKKLLPFFSLALALSSCKKGGDDPAPSPVVTSPYSQLLLGRWNKVSAEATISQLAAPPITTLVVFPAGTEHDVFTKTTVESFRQCIAAYLNVYFKRLSLHYHKERHRGYLRHKGANS